MDRLYIEYVGKVHVPSFALGLFGSILLYFLSPGILLVLGGLFSFLKFVIVCGGVIGAIFFLYTYRIKGMTLNSEKDETPKKEVKMKGEQNGGEFKYFNIPITKLENAEASEKVERSRWADVEKVNMLEVTKMKRTPETIVEEIEEIPREHPQMNESLNLRMMGDKTQVLNRNARYENFINMANHR